MTDALAPARAGLVRELPAPGALLSASAELIRAHAAIFAVLAIWAFAPLVATVIHVAVHGGVLTGPYGSDFFDQFQYMAWIRDEGEHLLASNLWVIGPSPHDYLQPMYAISGLLWRLGLSIQLAYLVWAPVALLVLFLGSAAYVRRFLAERGAQAAALILVLFYHSPVYAISRSLVHLSAAHQFQLLRATTDADAALQLWGFAHAAITIGLMPVFLLAAERMLGAPARREVRLWGVLAGVAGLLISWLHPWQGAILLVVIAAMFVLRPPRRRYVALIGPVVATAIPLVYTEVLAHSDASWRRFQSLLAANQVAPLWALIAAFAPLVVVAALGVRRPRSDGEWMLLLWPPACVAVYLFGPNTSPHALSAITLPLGVLAVRGWKRARTYLRVSSRIAVPGAIVVLLLFTVPAAVNEAQDARGSMANTVTGAVGLQQLRLTGDQAAAISYLDHAPRPGGVVAPWLVAMSVPQFTDRQVFAGHQWWGPPSNLALENEFFASSLPEPGAAATRRAILRRSHAAFVLADCDAPTTLRADLAPLARPVRRFGCVTVYETAG